MDGPLPQRLKSTFFEKFSSLQVSFGDLPPTFFSKNVDFSQNGFFPRFSSLCYVEKNITYIYLSYYKYMKYFLPYRRNVCWKFGGTFLGTQELIYVSSARLQNFLWVYTFLSLMELRSSCPDSDFLLGLLLPEEDIIGCNRLQSFDEFTTSLAS